MTTQEENRYYELTKKQKTAALNILELKELLRLSNKKKIETAAISARKPFQKKPR